jgi:alpha-N-acetylglucosamine transferase
MVHPAYLIFLQQFRRQIIIYNNQFQPAGRIQAVLYTPGGCCNVHGPAGRSKVALLDRFRGHGYGPAQLTTAGN